MCTIYLRLLNEGTDVWRLAEAAHIEGDLYRIEGQIPDHEEWEFAPGTIVSCQEKSFADGNALTAISAVV